MHPEPTLPRAGGSGYAAFNFVLLLLWAAPMLAGGFQGSHGQFGLLAVGFILLPRCFYAAPASLPIRVRRVFAIIGSVAIGAAYLSFLFTHIGKWTYLPVVCAILLLLDLYDHWLFTRLLSGRSAEAPGE